MEGIIDEILRAAVHLQECKGFLKSEKPEYRVYGEECAKEYLEEIKRVLDSFFLLHNYAVHTTEK
jgi:hypothetical protein